MPKSETAWEISAVSSWNFCSALELIKLEEVAFENKEVKPKKEHIWTDKISPQSILFFFSTTQTTVMASHRDAERWLFHASETHPNILFNLCIKELH